MHSIGSHLPGQHSCGKLCFPKLALWYLSGPFGKYGSELNLISLPSSPLQYSGTWHLLCRRGAQHCRCMLSTDTRIAILSAVEGQRQARCAHRLQLPLEGTLDLKAGRLCRVDLALC